ncbi:MAG: tripartite tricarboxylate transporter substrate-binding protein [Burkholderiales bacterium]
MASATVALGQSTAALYRYRGRSEAGTRYADCLHSSCSRDVFAARSERKCHGAKVPDSCDSTSRADYRRRRRGSCRPQRLWASFKQPVVIDNRFGANGNIGTQAVARGPADGHPLVVGSNANITTNPYL